MRIIKQVLLSLIFGSMLLATTSVMAETNILSFDNPSVIDIISGNAVNTVTVGQQYLIRTDFINPQTTEQKFVYTVHITNIADNTVLSNAVLEGVFAPGEEFSTSLSWEPVSCGDFIANFTVYDNSKGRKLLAESLTLPITIEGCTSEGTAIAETNILSFDNPSVIDIVSGNAVNTVTVGQQYLIRTDFINPQTTEQKFVYTVHITNIADNTVPYNAGLEGVFAPGEEFSTSLPWEPISCGDFIANFAVYDNFKDKNLLAESLTLPITIEGCLSEITPLDAFFQNIQNFFAELFA